MYYRHPIGEAEQATFNAAFEKHLPELELTVDGSCVNMGAYFRPSESDRFSTVGMNEFVFDIPTLSKSRKTPYFKELSLFTPYKEANSGQYNYTYRLGMNDDGEIYRMQREMMLIDPSLSFPDCIKVDTGGITSREQLIKAYASSLHMRGDDLLQAIIESEVHIAEACGIDVEARELVFGFLTDVVAGNITLEKLPVGLANSSS